MKSRLGDLQKQRSTVAQDNSNRHIESIIKQQQQMKTIDKSDTSKMVKSSIGTALSQKQSQYVDSNKQPLTVASSRQYAGGFSSQSSFHQSIKSSKPNTQSIIVSSTKIPPSSSQQNKQNGHTYNGSIQKQLQNDNTIKSRQINNFNNSVINSNNTTTTLNNTTHTKIANSIQSAIGVTSSTQHSNFVKALQKGSSVQSGTQSHQHFKPASSVPTSVLQLGSPPQQSGVNSTTLAQKLQQLQKQQ